MELARGWSRPTERSALVTGEGGQSAVLSAAAVGAYTARTVSVPRSPSSPSSPSESLKFPPTLST